MECCSGSASSPALWLHLAGGLFHYSVQAYLYAVDGCTPCTLERVFDWEQGASLCRGSAAAVALFAGFLDSLLLLLFCRS